MNKLNIEFTDFTMNPIGEYSGYLKINDENHYFYAFAANDMVNIRHLDKEGIFSIPMDKEVEDNINEVKNFILDKVHTHAKEHNVYEQIKPYQPEESFIDLQSICGSNVILNKEEQIYSIVNRGDLDYVRFEKDNKKMKAELASLPKSNPPQKLTESQEYDLKDTLEAFAGSLCYIDKDEDINNILEYGQFWYGKEAELIKGKDNSCHWNSCNLWEKNQDSIRICTGYALSEDGLWRSHSWAVKLKDDKTQLIETTVKRKAYFGVVLPTENCVDFYKRLNEREPRRLETWKAKTPDIVNKYKNNDPKFKAIKELLGELDLFSLEDKLEAAEKKAASQTYNKKAEISKEDFSI